MRFEDSLARAKGQGSGHSGHHHFIAQRLSAVFLLLLSPMLALWLLQQIPFEYENLRHAFSDPWVASLWALWLLAGTYHAQLGIQMVLEDYIQHLAWRYSLMISSYIILSFSLFWAWAALIKLLVYE